MIERVSHIAPLQVELKELEAPKAVADAFTETWKEEAAELARVTYAPTEVVAERIPENVHAAEARAIAEKMSDDELVAMLMGEITKGPGQYP